MQSLFFRAPKTISSEAQRKRRWLRKTTALLVAFCFALFPASAAVAVDVGLIPIDDTPTAVAVSPDGLFTYALMYGAGNTALTIVNTQTNTTEVIQLEGDSQDGDVAVSPDGATIYVADEDDGSIAFIDAVTHGVTVLDGFSSPEGIAVSPDGETAYVTDNSSDDLFVITDINTVARTYTIMEIPVGNSPLGVAVSPDGSSVYVANSYDDTLSVITDINVSEDTFSLSNVPVGLAPTDVAISPDGATIYVTNNGDWTIPFSGSVSIVDATSLTTSAPLSGYQEPWGIAVSPSGSNIVFASEDRVTVVNTVTGAKTRVDITGTLKGVAISPDGSTAYVANEFLPNPPRGSLSVLPLAALQPVATADTSIGSPYSFSIPNINATSFSVTAGSLPAGLSLNATTGEITGTPTATGTATFTITAVGELNSDMRSYTITSAPVLAATGLDSGAVSLIAGAVGAFSLLLVGVGVFLTKNRVRRSV